MKIKDWEVVMGVENSENIKNLSRRFRYPTLHAIATLTGRTDLEALAGEMYQSKLVNAMFCTTIQSPVFYLKCKFPNSYDSNGTWDMLKWFINKYPYPNVKGFSAANKYWDSGSYGIGNMIIEIKTMSEPFIEDDYVYANKIIDALKEAGFEPGIKKYVIN